MNKSHLLMGAAAFAVAISVSQPVFAQDTPAATADCVDADEDGVCDSEATSGQGSDIVVTGSRIRRDEYNAIEPITVVTAEEITQSGFNSATDALQSAEVTAGAGQINNFYGGFVTAGGTGANTLGLRNLGPARTLVLLNGRRIAPAGTRGNVLAADLNVLPTAIVERIEVLKAGASSVYGSDAVAGVVNIITDNKVRGLTIDAQVNVPEVGAGVDKRIAATFGFDTDRLNVIGSIEVRKRNALRLDDRGFTSCPIPGFRTGPDAEFGSDDPFPLGDPRNCFTIDNGGVTINTLGTPTRTGIGRTSGVLGNFNRFVPAPGQGGGSLPGYLGVGTYDRDSFDPESQKEELITPVKTYTGFLAATYDVGGLGNAEVYGELLATRRQSSSLLYRQLSLDYLQGSPLLPVELRDGVFAAPTNTTSGRNIAARAFIGFGLTDSSQEVDYVRAGGGIRGDFVFDGWRYDAYAGKSWTDGTYEIESFLIDRVAASTNVVQNPNGTFSCAAAATFANCVAAPALSADVVGGNLPQAWRDYILQNTIGTTKFRESTFTASIDGPLFKMPGGDVQLAIGVEYRKQRIDDTPDPNSISGNLLGLTAGTPTRGTDNVKEAFAEVFVPILSDRPFFHNLNLNASIRYTDYASYGSDYTYKIAGEWEFFEGFGIRGSYGTSYRAPALAEQFLGATSGFIGAANDPCDADNFPRANGQPNPGAYTPAQQQRAANCAAVGINVATFQQNNGITSFTRGGAETGLSAETSRNWSVGAVIQPRLPGTTTFAFAVDYFDIKVTNGVSALSGTTILNRCYNDVDFDPNGGFCRFVQRDANQILTVTSGFVNLAEDVVKGYEASLRFGTDLFGGRLLLNANVTKYTEQSDRTFPEEILLDANGTLNVPDWVGSGDLTYRKGPVTFRYGVTWFDGSSGTAEYNQTSRTTGVVNQANVDILNDFYVIETPAYFLHNASFQFDVNEKLEITMGVRNLFDKDPPKVTVYYTTIGNAPLYSGYDYTGRQYFVNATFKI
ncbi:TonB-dependent receptor [Sphingopyxis sp. QXT-31]|uniref:TonB-dependent receptor domain-containing protein n=1 Tax=Sphingopyxis sp. QXT-31 TaxID=1357916 RepID=UPI00097952FB|nr:TonB-dependent receptor [Sphingopyxis sp. QXT-31]APZ98311.1 TonB-dependent receptor [Sphingopyxis sp. QXT-31]